MGHVQVDRSSSIYMGTQQAGEGSKSSAHVLYLLPATNKSQTMDSKKVAYAVFIVILLMTEVAAAAAAGGSARGTGGTGTSSCHLLSSTVVSIFSSAYIYIYCPYLCIYAFSFFFCLGDRANDEEKFILGHLSKAILIYIASHFPGHIKECVNHVENQCGWAPAPGCLKEALATCAK